ncbi:MAG: peptidylprolyl isomerase [Elusimicrobia bacterium]|nr:peptidylprolyl isomerase [Elusimicrobiota bacterium]
MRTAHLTLVFAAVFAASCAPKAQETAQSRETAPETKTQETKPDMANLKNPALANAKAPETFKVKFTTTKGDFTLEVTRSWSPLGADRFYNLVKIGYFTDIAFFRVIEGFMVQFGIHGDPALNTVWHAANIPDDPVVESNRKGYISYAMAGPNTRTTQFFINYGNNANLDRSGFSPFGKVTDGMNVVESIYSGYGEGAPSGMGPYQGRVQTEGNVYLKKDFPKLDYILSAQLLN